MDARHRAFILSIPGMRTVSNAIVNQGNRAFVNRLGNQDDELDEIRGLRSGDRCFIVGNGPSLTTSDLALLENEDCFAANHVYKLFDKTAWRPTYYVIQDRYTQLDIDLSNIGAKAFFAGAYFARNNAIEIPDPAYVFCERRDLNGSAEYMTFSDDITDFVSSGYTVTYSMIQIAASLGYTEVYLVGIDHNYAVEVDEKGAVVRRQNVRNHAFEDVNKETTANIAGMEKAYRSALHYARESGRLSIFNATRGGHLEVFERVSLEEALTR